MIISSFSQLVVLVLGVAFVAYVGLDGWIIHDELVLIGHLCDNDDDDECPRRDKIRRMAIRCLFK